MEPPPPPRDHVLWPCVPKHAASGHVKREGTREWGKLCGGESVVDVDIDIGYDAGHESTI